MRIIHTYNGHIDLKHNDTILLYILSALYIHKLTKYREDNLLLVLYADKAGLQYLKDWLYLYDEVHEVKIPFNISNKCFAAIKYIALQQEPLDSLYIDGDVLIREDMAFNRIIELKKKSDIVVQSIEDYLKDYKDPVLQLLEGYNLKVDVKPNKQLCTGLMLFQNQSLKDTYIDMYFDLTQYVSPRLDKSDDVYSTDWLAEQQQLYALCKKYNYTVEPLLIGNSFKEQSKMADDIGFTHLWGCSKYIQINKVKKRIQQLLDDNVNI